MMMMMMIVMASRVRPIAAFVGRSGGWTLGTVVVNTSAPRRRHAPVGSTPRLLPVIISFSRLLSASHQLDSNKRDEYSTDVERHVELKRRAFLEKVRDSLRRNVLPNVKTNGMVMLVGVSGGCDSVGLLHALVQIMTPKERQGEFQWLDKTVQLHVVHFDHKQRGADSDVDAVFVQQMCSTLNLPCHVYDWDNPCSTLTTTAFSQNAARKWRRSTMYTLLQSLTCGEQGVILTAHHRDDSDETLLLKLLRGVHVTNLVGMDPVLVGGEEMPAAIVARPLLDTPKKDIIDFVTLLNLEWREDESNASDKYLRNRVRNELIPLLSDMVGGADVLQVRFAGAGTPL
jgi:tRNA(Ile)-lysidine synthetase-like protein